LSWRKYSNAIIEQASAIALKHGIPEAVKLTGVNKWTIRKHLAYLRKNGLNYYRDNRRGANAPICKFKHKPEAIRAALVSGVADHRATGLSLRQCVMRAAKAYGIGGQYLWSRVRFGYESLEGL
jgi:hypothetical protein